jgi:hypothetical protein
MKKTILNFLRIFDNFREKISSLLKKKADSNLISMDSVVVKIILEIGILVVFI